MSKLPEGRKPLSWRDMPFADRPKRHPSTERLEIEKLRERVAELEAQRAKANSLAAEQDTLAYTLGLFAKGRHLAADSPADGCQWVLDKSNAALTEYRNAREKAKGEE